MEKDKLIKREYNKLKKLYGDLPDNKKTLLAKLLENAAFMAATLQELQELINEEGAVIAKVNGNGFEVVQEHPAQKSYNSMIRNYSATIKQLDSLLPAQAKKSKFEELMNDE